MKKRHANRRVDLETLERRAMLHGVPQLVGDLNTAPPTETDYAWLGDEVFFAADDGTGDVELWKSDGTAEGTVRVADIRPGEQGSLPMDFATADGRVLFTAYSDEFGRELWATDGTKYGTMLVQDFAPGATSSDPSQLTSADGKVFFVQDADHRDELWVSDGTSEGTVPVPPNESNPPSDLDNLTVVGDRVFYSADHDNSGSTSLRMSDAAGVGTTVVRTFSGNPRNLVEWDGSLYFAAGGHGTSNLWTTDGTKTGTTTIRNSGSYQQSLVTTDEFLFFFSEARTNDRQGLWRSDGTNDGTVRVKDFGPSAELSSLTVVGNAVFFSVDNRLWQSDGTPEGTARLPEITNPRHLHESSGQLYFSANHGASGNELWRTDGTTQGTQLLDVNPGTNGSNPTVMTAQDGTTLFWATDGDSRGLWAVDDEDGTLRQLQQGLSGRSNSSDPSLTKVDGELFISAQDHTGQWQWWQTDGDRVWQTETGPSTDHDANDQPSRTNLTDELPRRSQVFAMVGDVLLFTVEDQLWRTDGTVEGAYQLADVEPYAAELAEDRLFFVGYSEEAGEELWVTDGTVEGTGVVKDIAPGGQGCGPADMVSLGGTVYFTASKDGARGLWKSDGTEDGTVLIKEGYFTPISSGRDVVYLVGDDAATGRELWQSDGTEAGTVLVYDLNPGPEDSIKYRTNGSAEEVNGQLYFTGDDGFHGRELWTLPLDQERLPGDADGNGSVDFADFLSLSENYRTAEEAIFADGDFDENGIVNFADFLILSANFGKVGGTSLDVEPTLVS